MIVYIDNDYKCHVENDGTMTAVQVDFFDGKCKEYVEGYRFIPEGQTWTREDGAVFRGEMRTPLKPMNDLSTAQQEYEQKKNQDLATIGAKQVYLLAISSDKAPDAEAGIFAEGTEKWTPGETYNQYDLFQHNGAMGYVKQTHTALEIYPPFSVGTEALYGARPAPDEEGIYPYVYNMAAAVGMKVREDGIVYQCIQAIGDMLYPPSQLAAHFVKDEDE